MSGEVETLRRAASLMRERATHPDVVAAPWKASPHGDVYDDGLLWVCDSQSGETAAHIASWHPDVALAVADWLVAESHQPEEQEEGYTTGGPSLMALRVARAYLGESS